MSAGRKRFGEEAMTSQRITVETGSPSRADTGKRGKKLLVAFIRMNAYRDARDRDARCRADQRGATGRGDRPGLAVGALPSARGSGPAAPPGAHVHGGAGR